MPRPHCPARHLRRQAADLNRRSEAKPFEIEGRRNTQDYELHVELGGESGTRRYGRLQLRTCPSL